MGSKLMTRLREEVLVGTLCGLAVCWTQVAAGAAPVQELPAAETLSKLPGNCWILIDREDDSGGKRFARAVLAEGVDRLCLWGTMAYDPQGDQVILFGGGLATNPSGAAPTWLFDCSTHAWCRPKLQIEPPPRCNAAIVYEPVTKRIVLFGGYDQAAALNDTAVHYPEIRLPSGRAEMANGLRTQLLAFIHAQAPVSGPALLVLPGLMRITCRSADHSCRSPGLARSHASSASVPDGIGPNR